MSTPPVGRAPVKSPPVVSRCALSRAGGAAVSLLGGLVGCVSHAPPVVARPTTQAVTLAVASGLSTPLLDPELLTDVVPPAGWKLTLRKADSRHIHKVWLSPTGATAYGVIYFHLPFPVGPDFALIGFLQQMKVAEGDAKLISRSEDPALPGVRFVADGRHYRIRAKLTTSGFDGWACYAGTRLDRPVNQPELQTDLLAREQTPLP